MNTQTIFLLVITLAVINAFVVPAVIFLADTLTSFVMRTDRKKWLTEFCTKKYKCAPYDIDEGWFNYDFLGGVFVTAIAFLSGCALDGLWGINYISGSWLLLPLSIIVLPFVLRFVVDVTRNLKLDNGDSKRLRKLEAEIKSLKGE